MRKNNIGPLVRNIGYQFNNQDLLRLALTHRSFGKRNNERLEFIGDSILNYTVALRLYHKFPAAREGELSRLRASLVKGETLALIANDLQLSDYVILGEGELKSGGFRRASILADTVEAIIGAIAEDSNFEAAQSAIDRWFSKRLADITLVDTEKDAKTQLQEWLQGKGLALPEYKVVEVAGLSHCQSFTVACSVAKLSEPTTATAQNRRQAEKEAAAEMLSILTKAP